MQVKDEFNFLQSIENKIDVVKAARESNLDENSLQRFTSAINGLRETYEGITFGAAKRGIDTRYVTNRVAGFALELLKQPDASSLAAVKYLTESILDIIPAKWRDELTEFSEELRKKSDGLLKQGKFEAADMLLDLSANIVRGHKQLAGLSRGFKFAP